ncbi:MAG: PaaI family thioesterase [Candidatus Rokubacteria bacterium]|nr:PaaI family thioesterase [Candidatus Rokubacteria bacterium]
MTDEGASDPGPLVRLLGIRRTSSGNGACRFDLTVRPEHMNPYGVVHGGVVYSLVDTAMGGALVSQLGPGERCATLEIKINYLAPVSEGTLAADARVVARTRRIGVLDATVRDGGDRLVAVATGSFYIQDAAKDDARG